MRAGLRTSLGASMRWPARKSRLKLDRYGETGDRGRYDAGRVVFFVNTASCLLTRKPLESPSRDFLGTERTGMTA